ncbi:MAG: hypothetical protein FWH02_04110 [Oscillospiraceae bacterium]|nr:hypothetical protein [Oscillospiraceae bacterium]
MGSYHIIFGQLLRRLFPDAQVLMPPPITQKTVDIGGRYSPDFVCAPFKLNLGNYIEALEAGANTLFQSGLGCRYGYYGELQEQILRDLGYDFTFVCLSRQRARPLAVSAILRGAGCPLPAHKIGAAFYLAAKSAKILDEYEYWMRENVGFEAVPGSCAAIHENLLNALSRAFCLRDLRSAQSYAARAISKIKLNRPENPLRVGIVGDLYTLMEPSGNFYLEKQLAREGVAVSRIMGLCFLLTPKNRRRLIGESGGYLMYPVGANGADSVSQSLSYARMGYDGILHIKSFGCIPELNAAPALANLCGDEGIPILELSFDCHTSRAGTETRIEAFADMLRRKRDAKIRTPGA